MATTTLRDALIELHPTADSADNDQIADVIGNKDDTVAGDSVIALLRKILSDNETFDNHIHARARCYPSLAAGVTINGGVGAWVLGSATVVVPINTITSQFDIHHIEVEAASANDIYELVLYSDAAATVEIGRTRSSKQSNQAGATSMPFQCPIQAANAGIWAKLASSTGGDNMTISIFYHVY